jgi:uncharacterized membrane protein
MDIGLVRLGAACAAFVGSHMLLSGPLRRAAARLLGPRGFLAFYSLIALVALGWMIFAFDRAPAGPALWDGTRALPWTITSALTLPALVLLLGSFSGNPALPDANLAGLSARKPWGIFRVTRHPMMMGIALWAVSHVIVMPTARMALFNLSLAALALGGAAAQDRRKLAQNHREWSVWMARTRFWPRLAALGDMGALWAAALLLWLAVTAAHLWLGGVPAGVWRLVG